MKTRREFMSMILKGTVLIGVVSVAPSYALSEIKPKKYDSINLINCNIENCNLNFQAHKVHMHGCVVHGNGHGPAVYFKMI